MKTDTATSFRLTLEAKRLLQITAQHLGVSQTAVIEIAIRRIATQEVPNVSRETIRTD